MTVKGIGGTRAILLAACAAIVLVPAAAHAQSGDRIRYNIQARDLGTALTELARQSNREIYFSADLTRGRRAPRLSGQLTLEQALDRLLRGSGLTYRFNGSGAIMVEPVSGEAEAGSAAADSESADDTIVVTGTNIRGVYPSSSPVQSFTAEHIERTGATTTAQFMSRLPQNRPSITPFEPTSGSRESVNGIDLRGLGVGTTLVLVNGRRLSLANRGQTADISMIPVSAIEQVQVLTDGASAIYGSDAIGGVVNFVLRRDFDGAETRASYGGVSSGGLRQTNLTQTFGRQWGSGHGLISYDYFNATALDRSDRPYAQSAPGTLSPSERRHNLLATISQQITDRLSVDVDLLLGDRRTRGSWSQTSSANRLIHVLNTDSTDETQGLFNLGVDYDLSDAIRVSMRASYSRTGTDRRSVATRFNDPAAAPVNTRFESRNTALDAGGMVSGRLLRLPGGHLRFSLGAGILDETYVGPNLNSQTSGADIARRTSYAFLEIFAPLIGPEQGIPLINRLELTLAGRFTDIQDRSRPAIDRDFGNSTDPKVGVFWAPIPALGFRATYGTSFRAPSLLQIDPVAASSGQIIPGFPLPFPGGPLSTGFAVTGSSPFLRAETAKTYTLGLDFRPIPSLSFSATYYGIDYTDRIARPDFGGDPVTTPDAFPELIIRNPSAAVIEDLLRSSVITQNFTSVDLSDPAAAAQIFAADPRFFIYDLRLRNLASSEQEGLDFNVVGTFPTRFGQLRVGANINYILRYDQQLLASKPATSVVDTAGFPPDFRGQFYAGFSHGGFDGTLSVNYVDDYVNLGDPNGPRQVDSWTTIDLNLAYDFRAGRGSLPLRASLSIQNLFDEDPPFLLRAAADARFGYDPANANPLGRFFTLALSMSW